MRDGEWQGSAGSWDMPFPSVRIRRIQVRKIAKGPPHD